MSNPRLRVGEATMLKSRVRRVEEKIRMQMDGGKKLQAWTVIVDAIAPGTDVDREAEKQIADIKAGSVPHKDGSHFSDEDTNVFVIRIITNERPSE